MDFFWFVEFVWGMFNCKELGWEFSLTQRSSIRCLDFVAFTNRSGVEDDREDLRVPAEDSLMAMFYSEEMMDWWMMDRLGFT
mmetsp:Transcript_8336/g.20068  ORF Transcript_8336/g.20068 Transcript_8336/m.20068 type:complete len:82 (-) Transcript_8336:156-401(-)